MNNDIVLNIRHKKRLREPLMLLPERKSYFFFALAFGRSVMLPSKTSAAGQQTRAESGERG